MLNFIVSNWEGVIVFLLILAVVVMVWKWASQNSKLGFLGILVTGLTVILFLFGVYFLLWLARVGPVKGAEFVNSLKRGVLVIDAAADSPAFPAGQVVVPPPTPFVVVVPDPNAGGGSPLPTVAPLGCWAGRTVPVGVMLHKLTNQGPVAVALAIQVDFLSGVATGDPANPLCSTQRGAWVWPRDLP